MAFLGGIFGGNSAGAQGAAAGGAALQAGVGTANRILRQGEASALGQYGTDYYDPYSKTGDQANTMYADALGLNGPGGNAAATGAFQASPGYQWQTDQGIQALDRSAAGNGMFGSGNAAEALARYGQGNANQEYGNWLQRLQGLGGQGLQAAGGQTGRQGSLAGINEWGAGGRAGNVMNAADQYSKMIEQGMGADQAANASGMKNIFSALLGGANLGAKAYSGGLFG